MKATTPWILIDTETNGLTKPIFALDLAAQKMRGWKKIGKPFRFLLNHAVPPRSIVRNGKVLADGNFLSINPAI
jgi:hypothetical protein